SPTFVTHSRTIYVSDGTPTVQNARISQDPLVAHRLLIAGRSLPNTLQLRRASRYIEMSAAMNRLSAGLIGIATLACASHAWADARSDAKSQVAFGINVAQRGLWREAIYRWEKAVEIDPSYAAAFNDLAIAYEHEGQLDKARKAYEKALEL